MQETPYIVLHHAISSGIISGMQSSRFSSPPRAVVVGVTGKQAEALRDRLGARMVLRILMPDRALKFRGDASNVIVTTRFIGHKHEWHLRSVAACPVVCVRSGGLDAPARVLTSMLKAAYGGTRLRDDYDQRQQPKRHADSAALARRTG